MKIVSLVGARPQFIKEAVLHQSLMAHGVEEVVVNSGQHYDFNMADVFFETLGIGQPDYDLEIGSGKHGEMTGKIIIEFEKVLEKENPDAVLVFGDTNTTLAGAIVSSKMKIPLAHVEAGVRMKPKDMPEEINRVLTDHVSSYLFCSSQMYVENLKKENISENVYFTGDVTYDLYLMMKDKFKMDLIPDLSLKEGQYFVVTIHRDYNTDDPKRLEEILKQLNKLSSKFDVVFPMHPRTRKKCSELGFEKYLDELKVLEPIEYLDLQGLVSKCNKVITDSGGLQKEGYYAGKTSVVVMPDPAWVELVDKGINKLVEPEGIYEKCVEDSTTEMDQGIYGNGAAGEKIVNILLDHEK